MPDQALRQFQDSVQRELRAHGASSDIFEGVAQIPYQTNQGYDELLAESIVFLHLYDAIANNTVVECIVRNTPVPVNKLPSVVEYLGRGYPFYFESLAEAARKADDIGCIRATWQYLQELPKQRFSGESFRTELARSELYKAL